MKHAISILLLCCALFAQENILAGKKAVFENAPDYNLTRSDTDAVELTDGKFRENDRIWFHKESVGWYASAPVHSFYFDFGEQKDIGKVRVHASAGAGGVQWPEKLLVLAGYSPNTFALLEDLAATEREQLARGQLGSTGQNTRQTCNSQTVNSHLVGVGREPAL